MDYAAIRDAFKTWVKNVTGMPARWEDEPTGLQLKMPAHFVLTGPVNVENVGEDVVRYDEVEDEVQAAVVGWREFDIMVRCISRSSDPNKSAQVQLEKLRTALSRPSTSALFDGIFAVLSMSKSVQYNAPFEERVESIAGATWRCTAVVDEAVENTDGRDAPESTLTQVELTSKIKGEDGLDLPTSLSLEESVISGG